MSATPRGKPSQRSCPGGNGREEGEERGSRKETGPVHLIVLFKLDPLLVVLVAKACLSMHMVLSAASVRAGEGLRRELIINVVYAAFVARRRSALLVRMCGAEGELALPR